MTEAPKWIAGRFCVNCHRELTEEEEKHNGCVCPYCGFCDTEDTKGTGAAVYIRSKRWIVDVPKKSWQFWKTEKGHWEYGKRQVNS